MFSLDGCERALGGRKAAPLEAARATLLLGVRDMISLTGRDAILEIELSLIVAPFVSASSELLSITTT